MRALILMLCLVAGPASAEWRFEPKWSDPIDGFQTRVATNTNADGFTLHLYRNPIGRVYALYALPDGTADLAQAGAVATLTPQGFTPKAIEARSERGRIVEYAISTGRALRDRLWHGEGQAPAFGTFHDVLAADTLTVSFTLADGSTTDTTWSMDGANRALAQALGIASEGIPAGAEWEDAAAQALLAAMTACQFPKLDVLCVQKVSACSTKISDERDIDGFDSCVAEDG